MSICPDILFTSSRVPRDLKYDFNSICSFHNDFDYFNYMQCLFDLIYTAWEHCLTRSGLERIQSNCSHPGNGWSKPITYKQWWLHSPAPVLSERSQSELSRVTTSRL